MSDAVIDDGQYTDDVVQIGGHSFAAEGPIRYQNIAEFSTGLKIGAARYDDREHAFYTVLDDFSGGFGYRNLDVREAGGTHWDNRGGVDLRRARHITLPPKRTSVTPNLQPANLSTFFSNQKSMVVSDVGGTEYLQIGVGGSMYTLSADRTTMTRRANFNPVGRVIDRINRVLEFTDDAGDKKLYAFGFSPTPGDQRYWISSNGTTWVEGTAPEQDKSIVDAIVWDSKIIAHDESQGIISSANGVDWSDDIPNDGVHWKPGGYVTFIGVAMAPWGQAVPYFLDEGKLFALDYYVYNAIEIQDVRGNEGVVWNGSIFISDGQTIWSYNPGAGESVRELGPFGKDGTPDSWFEDNYAVMQFVPGTSTLFAVCRGGVAYSKTRILAFTGTGWTWFGPEFGSTSDDRSPYSAIVDRFPINLSLDAPSRAIDIVTAEQGGGGTNVRLNTFALPVASEVPYQGSGASFEDGPLSFETGWYDGGFADLDGALLRMEFDGYHITDNETVLVEYRLNNDETADYINLGDQQNFGAFTIQKFTRNQQAIWFDEKRKGVEFRTVQFRITLDRGSDSTKSPELKSLVLIFDKKADLRAAWAFTIDIDRSVDRGFFDSRHEALEALRAIWNTKTLVPFIMPSGDPSERNVRISELVATFEEARLEDTMRARVNLTLLEPVV